jgi:hypothetical protein
VTLCLACTALLLAQDKHPKTDHPPAAKSDEKRPNQPTLETEHGPINVLSDTGGTDVQPYLDRVWPLIKATWYKVIPESAEMKKGKVAINFRLMKDGQINPLTGFDANRSDAFPLSSRPLGFGRNSLATTSQVQFDLRVLKFFKVGEHGKLDFVVESFNLLNHTNVVALNHF